MKRSMLGFALPLVLGLSSAGAAHAHFKLLKPASWLKEDDLGGPQKGGPCGLGGIDDASGKESGAITTYKAGETITVQWVDTVAHPGYFRIALAENRDDLKNPTVTQDGSCNFDESKVPKTASGNVLADGISFRTRNGFTDKAGKMFSTQVTLPKEPCDNCTLQVMQVMENDLQVLSNCYYFHCANIRIVAADAADAGTSGTVTYPDGGTTAPGDGDGDGDGDRGDGDSSGDGDGDGDGDRSGDGDGEQHGDNGGPSSTPKSDSGCSVGHGQSQAGLGLALAALGLAFLRRRARARKS